MKKADVGDARSHRASVIRGGKDVAADEVSARTRTRTPPLVRGPDQASFNVKRKRFAENPQAACSA